jgi:hypothetical protein
MRSDLIPALAAFAGQAAFLGLMPVFLTAAGTRIINGLQDARLAWTPVIELAAFFTGVAAGVIVLAHNIDQTTLGAGEVFRAGGPWDMTFGEFLAREADPFRYDISSILPLPFSGQSPSVPGIAVLVVAGVLFYAPILIFRSRRAIANGVRNAFLMVSAAYLTVYGFAYFLWLLNRLNFWIFLVVMIMINLRSRTQRIVLKLN